MTLAGPPEWPAVARMRFWCQEWRAEACVYSLASFLAVQDHCAGLKFRFTGVASFPWAIHDRIPEAWVACGPGGQDWTRGSCAASLSQRLNATERCGRSGSRAGAGVYLSLNWLVRVLRVVTVDSSELVSPLSATVLEAQIFAPIPAGRGGAGGALLVWIFWSDCMPIRAQPGVS